MDAKPFPKYEGDDEMFSPMKKNVDFLNNSDDQIKEFFKEREEKKGRIINDVKNHPYLKSMAIVEDCISLIDVTRLIDEISTQQRNLLITIIEETIDVVHDEYITIEEHKSKVSELEDVKAKIVRSVVTSGENSDSIIQMKINDICGYLDKQCEKKDMTRKSLSGLMLGSMRIIQADSSLTNEQKEIVKGMMKAKVEELALMIDKRLEASLTEKE